MIKRKYGTEKTSVSLSLWVSLEREKVSLEERKRVKITDGVTVIADGEPGKRGMERRGRGGWGGEGAEE